MPKKKTNYNRRGFAKRLSSRIFSRRDKTSKPEDQWRPRKTKFAALGGDDDDDFSAPTIINNFSFSVESETGGYKRDIDIKKKQALRKLNKKTDFAGINIQPSSRDKHTNSARKKKQRTDTHGFPLSSEVSTDYSFHSRQSAGTKQTTMSDPTNLFSSKPAALTKNNLCHFSNDIENQNPRSKFHQFTIDEDKESTVILPVGFTDDDETTLRTFDDDVSSSRYSGSRRKNSSYERAFTPFTEESRNAFNEDDASTKENTYGGRPSATSLRGSDVKAGHNTYSQSHNPSIASLCYSPSPKHESYSFTSSSKRLSGEKSSKNQQRFIRGGRTPLSPLNGTGESKSGANRGFQKKNAGFSGLGSWSDFVQDTSSNNRSGFESTDNISDIFEEKSSQIFETRHGVESKWSKGLYGFSGESKPASSFDSVDSAGTFLPRLEEEVPMGIQRFEGASKGSSAHSSVVSAASQGRVIYNRRVTPPSFDEDDVSHSHHSVGRSVGRSSHGGSVAKPMGLPSNAIMASMLFQRHHKIDTRAVETKVKAKHEENSKLEGSRGDVPGAIQALDDMYSCVSSFSEDTSVGPWKKPTRDLLDHFSNSRSTEYDAGRFRRDQLAKAPTLFEA